MNSEPPLFPGKRVSGDNNLLYAALHPFALPGWMSPNLIQLKGANWQVIFKLDGADYLDIESDDELAGALPALRAWVAYSPFSRRLSPCADYIAIDVKTGRHRNMLPQMWGQSQK